MTGDTRKRGLGRGLDALLGESVTSSSGRRGTDALPVDLVTPGRLQPRRLFDDDEMAALVRSVRENGILQPILVRPDPTEAGRYEIIAGERRWRAAQEAGLHEIPAIVRQFSDPQALEVALVENLQRQDLTPLEEADGYRRLMEEFRHTQEELARAVGKSRSHVANTMRLLTLPDGVKEMLAKGGISAGHARAMINAADPEDLARQVLRRGLTVRQTEKLAQSGKPAAARHRPPPTPKDPDTISLEREMSTILGLVVVINDRGGGGELIIRYSSLEQLDDVIGRLNSPAIR